MGQIFGGSGAPLAFSSASGGKVYAWNTIGNVTPVTVAPANPSRQKITFHNPGTVDVLVYPQFTLSATGGNIANPATVAAKGGSFLVYANGGTLAIEGECQGAWLALSVTATGNPFTVMDSNT